ncbi:MAG TPA: NUDIX domain-containing protein [Vitreimonas sp.]|uniref:NUDIX domain-containing protein n=1 Tax=Vitreimonas sp. TaxID=3069702 RepID=UPI002D4DFDDA|nr:NUDIX domain-containing protein [Vitreimonas sp.]HYD86019.1 NUDIX domain-containing protein [Vitreimonas sp.]
MVKPRTLGVRAVVLDDHGKVALVRHTYDKFWYLPGGGVEKGESFEAALRRELAEEIGVVDFRLVRVLGVYHNRREHKDDHIAVFVVQVSSGDVTATDAVEIREAGFFPLEALPAGVSPATKRRLEEVRSETASVSVW